MRVYILVSDLAINVNRNAEWGLYPQQYPSVSAAKRAASRYPVGEWQVREKILPYEGRDEWKWLMEIMGH
jgi:hypothetical protein